MSCAIATTRCWWCGRSNPPGAGSEAMFSKIVVPLDGSTAAECALPLVRALARRLAIAVELLSVIDLREISRDISAAEGLFLDQLVEYDSRHSAEYLGKIAKTFDAVKATTRCGRGTAAETI